MASIRSVTVESPTVVSLPGLAAGSLGVALSRTESRITVELLREEGIRAEVVGASGAVAKAAVTAATRLLEDLGEEAVLRIRLEQAEPPVSPVASAVAGVAAAITKLLGVEPAPMDLARVLNTVVAEVAGVPQAPLVAAAMYGGVAAGSENPPLYTWLTTSPSWRVYVVEAFIPSSEETVMITIDRYRQVAAAIAALISYTAREGWEERLRPFLSAESPWDTLLPAPLAKARQLLLREEAVLGAGIDPYQQVLVAVASDEVEVRPAAKMLVQLLDREPFVVESQISPQGAIGPREQEE
ncbi:hypothetical protein PYJP_01820 [Pyrofollis japonicus]|uniref:hypothetical protein n=1 Tax=Pyrofollis japonicus TaxID=3060460 RepID=UPI00295A8BE6|nr:hypothetical protein [Pyrofollis japonicus]BEP16830.1 hypothetical protein PYJP_01820 [Pyrofollis japonicus]